MRAHCIVLRCNCNICCAVKAKLLVINDETYSF